MSERNNKESKGLFGGIFMAYSILLLHVLLVTLVGFVVLFFRGVTSYLPWIFFGGAALMSGAGYALYRRMRSEGRSLREMLRTPLFRGRSVEISLLGGMASLRLGRVAGPESLETGVQGTPRQLESPASMRLRELSELARLLENELISLEEYNQTKQQLFNSR